MPVSVRDWLPEDHFAWFVLEAVEQLDLSAFHAAYRDDGWGRQAYDPAMMLALLLYAYCEGERSSRRIERRCREDIAYRVLSANQQPDHATICRFRQRHEQALAGTVRRGAAAVRRGRSWYAVRAWWRWTGPSCAPTRAASATARQAKLEADVERMLAEAEQADAEEQADSGRQRSDALPPELRSRSQRLTRLREARLAAREQERQDAYEARLREREQKDARGRQPKRPTPDPETKVNLSDPDSRVVRDYWGHYQGYNAQAAATSEQVIVAAELTRAATDVQELEPMVEDDESQSGGAGSRADGDPADRRRLLLRRQRPVAGRGWAGAVDRQSQRPQPACGRPGSTRGRIPDRALDARADGAAG